MLWRLLVALAVGIIGVWLVGIIISIIAALIPVILIGGVFIVCFCIAFTALNIKKPAE